MKNKILEILYKRSTKKGKHNIILEDEFKCVAKDVAKMIKDEQPNT